MGMLTQAVIRLHRLALLVALALALATPGMSHRMLTPQQDAALAFALANGASPADFCGDDLAGGGAHGEDCQVCQIASPVGLALITGRPVALRPVVATRVTAPRESRALRRILDPANAPQGPPVA